MFFPSPSMWKMVKEDPKYVMTDITGLAKTSHEIIEDGHVPIFPVVLSNPDSLQLNCDPTGIPLFTFCMEVHTICI